LRDAYGTEPFVRVPANIAGGGGGREFESRRNALIVDRLTRAAASSPASASPTLIKGGAGHFQNMNLMLADERLARIQDRTRDSSGAIVVKLGGEVIRGAALAEIATERTLAKDDSLRLVVVHGGGPQTSELQQRLGQTPHVVGGRRITDDPALEALKMAVVGGANVDLCAALTRAGARPVGLHGASSGVIRAEKRPPRVVIGAGAEPIDLGHVGDVVGFDRPLIDLLHSAGYLPVLACLGADREGRLYNIKADIVAARSRSSSARAMVLLTGVPECWKAR
jgi:acetylglutamate kinase